MQYRTMIANEAEMKNFDSITRVIYSGFRSTPDEPKTVNMFQLHPKIKV